MKHHPADADAWQSRSDAIDKCFCILQNSLLQFCARNFCFCGMEKAAPHILAGTCLSEQILPGQLWSTRGFFFNITKGGNLTPNYSREIIPLLQPLWTILVQLESGFVRCSFCHLGRISRMAFLVYLMLEKEFPRKGVYTCIAIMVIPL